MNILKILTPKRLLGNIGEDAAARYLKRQKYKILARNYVADCGEVDIVAKDGDTTVFIEVKARTYKEPSPYTARPAAAVNKEKQRRLIGCAARYMHDRFTEGRVRFDVVEVYTERVGERDRVKKINHIKAAFDKSSAYAGYKG